MTTSGVTSDSSASANRTGVYLAVLQLVFTLGWTTYVIYLPKLAAQVGIAPSAVILILMLAINAGEDGSVIVGKILEKDQYAYGFDSQTGEYVNLISKGIIDPTKVVRAAIQNAASVSSLFLTTEAVVTRSVRDGAVRDQAAARTTPGSRAAD